MTTNQQNFYDAFNNRKREFEMFTAAGNKKAQSIARAAIRKIFGQKRVTKEEIVSLVSNKLNETYLKGKHKEIWDTEPPYHISYYINMALEEANYDFEIDRYDFECRV